jgi:hypothetical protein
MVAILAVMSLYYFSGTAGPSSRATIQVQDQEQDLVDTDHLEFQALATGEKVSIVSLSGVNEQHPPPIMWNVGPSPDQDSGPDLSTPDNAVQSVLSLLDEGAADAIATCFVELAADPVEILYPHYLGHPIELVDVNETGDTAIVTWKAAVKIAFSFKNHIRSPGDTVILTTSLVQIDGCWRVHKLH